MHSQTVHEVLESIKSIHHSLVEEAKKAGLSTTSPRCKLVMDYISSYENEIEGIIQDMDGKTKKNVLNAWVRHYSGNPRRAFDKVMADHNITTEQGLLEGLVGVKAKLLEFYDSCIHGLSNPEAQDLFERLKNYEQSQLNNLGRRAVELEQHEF